MLVTIKYFGMLVEITNTTEESINMNQDIYDLNTLKKDVLIKYPTLNNNTYNIAVNQKIVTVNIALNNGDEVALLPPFAGG